MDGVTVLTPPNLHAFVQAVPTKTKTTQKEAQGVARWDLNSCWRRADPIANPRMWNP